MKIDVIQEGKTHSLQTEAGRNLMDCLLSAGVTLSSECAGRGVCGKCAVTVRSGALESVSAGELLPAPCGHGRVLACKSLVKEDVVIEISSTQADESRKVHLRNLSGKTVFSDPTIKKIYVSMPEPSLQEQLPDLERLFTHLGGSKKVSRRVLQKLPETLRSSQFAVTAVLAGEELIAVEHGDTQAEKYGFVFDIGTTTIAAYLVDMTSGNVLGADGKANPQRIFGADVLSRIAAASVHCDQLEKMQALTLETIAGMMRRLFAARRLSEDSVYAAVVVGNTTMSHIFLGIDPGNLALAPFIPCFCTQMSFKGAEFGLPMHPNGEVRVLPNISGYVGSDALGVLMATGMSTLEGYSLAVDIGTNGEIALGGGGRIFACSAAAGPAFEGSHIQNGMRAGSGAIESVHIRSGEIRLRVIDDSAPLGLCGSGLIDAVAELLRAGLVGARGRLAAFDSPGVSGFFRSRLRTRDGMREFVLLFAGEQGCSQDIVITQKDIRELQLAKGAIAAGIRVLAGEMGIEAGQIDRVFLAGAFGNYINLENAATLGMFPGIMIEKIESIGNAAGEGARLALLSEGQRKVADDLAQSVLSVELSASKIFNTLFIQEINFPAW